MKALLLEASIAVQRSRCVCKKIRQSEAGQGGTCCTVRWLRCLQTGIQEMAVYNSSREGGILSSPEKPAVSQNIFLFHTARTLPLRQWLWVPGGSRILGTNFLRVRCELLKISICATQKGVTAYQFFLLTSLSTVLLVINLSVWMIYGLCCFPTCFGVGVFRPSELTFCDSKLLFNY